MSELIAPVTKHAPIRVSELGDWVYCSVAWKLRGEGVSPDPQGMLELERCREFHQDHGAQVARSVVARKAKPWLLAAILITGGLLVLYLRRSTRAFMTCPPFSARNEILIRTKKGRSEWQNGSSLMSRF